MPIQVKLQKRIVKKKILIIYKTSEELTKTICSGAIYRTKYTRRINPTATTEVFQRSQFGVDCEIENPKSKF